MLSGTTPPGEQSRGSRDFVGIAFFSCLCAGTAVLGVWQTKRYFWKVELLESGQNKIEEGLDELPRCFHQEQLSEFARAHLGRRVSTSGTFDHDRELLLGLRTAPLSISGSPAQGMASNPQGYYVITPFTREDGTLIFVNRGWIPRMQQQWYRPKGTVKLEAVVVDCEQGGMFAPDN